MSIRGSCVAVIPCLNEAGTIQPLIRAVTQELRGHLQAEQVNAGTLAAVLVVDDGSSDATARLAEEAGASVLRHERTLGKGTALQAGLNQAQHLGFIWALTLDGDGQHAPEDIPHFFRAAELTAADLVVGNRMEQAERMPWVRRHVNRWMSRRLSRVANQPWPDTQCGFRLVHLTAWAALDLRTKHFEIESEMLLAFAAAGYRVEFVPIQVIYRNERSKIHPLRDTWRWFRWLHQWNGKRGR